MTNLRLCKTLLYTGSDVLSLSWFLSFRESDAIGGKCAVPSVFAFT